MNWNPGFYVQITNPEIGKNYGMVFGIGEGRGRPYETKKGAVRRAKKLQKRFPASKGYKVEARAVRS